MRGEVDTEPPKWNSSLFEIFRFAVLQLIDTKSLGTEAKWSKLKTTSNGKHGSNICCLKTKWHLERFGLRYIPLEVWLWIGSVSSSRKFSHSYIWRFGNLSRLWKWSPHFYSCKPKEAQDGIPVGCVPSVL